jgi:hypothetical protein
MMAMHYFMLAMHYFNFAGLDRLWPYIYMIVYHLITSDQLEPTNPNIDSIIYTTEPSAQLHFQIEIPPSTPNRINSVTFRSLLNIASHLPNRTPGRAQTNEKKKRTQNKRPRMDHRARFFPSRFLSSRGNRTHTHTGTWVKEDEREIFFSDRDDDDGTEIDLHFKQFFLSLSFASFFFGVMDELQVGNVVWALFCFVSCENERQAEMKIMRKEVLGFG